MTARNRDLPPALNEAQVLSFDPFEGDFGGGGDDDGLLSDKMVTGRKPYACHTCEGSIAVGERHRSRSEVYDGEFMSFRWCAECCLAMALDDDGYELRVAIGNRVREARRVSS